MYKNVKAIKETLKGLGLKVKDADEVAKIIKAKLEEQVKPVKTTTAVPVKKAVRKSAVAVDQITKPEYTIQLGNNQFVVPVKTGLGKTGERFRFNENGILLYSGKDTETYIEEIAKKIGLKDAAKIVFPTKEETEKMYNDQAFRKALGAADIYWIPFILDKKDENRNVSLKEYWENPDKFRFCDRYIHYGYWYNYLPDHYYYYNYYGAVVLGGLK
ncbi:MAG: hypothetical protein KKA19_07195 [Candidatus Margulisbacteria bacterium]|nr:hypothetical protein [Candidatus Margulisiibacteriota bacterium]